MPPGTRRNHQPYTRGSLSAGHGDASTRALVNFGAEQNSSRRSLNQSTVLSDRTALIMSRPATLGATRSPRDVAVGRATRVLSLAVWPGDGGVVRRGNNIDGAVLLFVIAVVARAVIGAMSERLAASVAESPPISPRVEEPKVGPARRCGSSWLIGGVRGGRVVENYRDCGDRPNRLHGAHHVQEYPPSSNDEFEEMLGIG
jgi:hypothetical protein